MRARALRARGRARARANARSRAAPRSACTSRRAACGRTSSAAACRSGASSIPQLRETFPDALARRRARGLVPLGQLGRAVADPRRGRRGDVQPAHHPPLRARAGAARRARSTLEDLPEVWNERMREYLGVEPPNDRARRAPGHALGDRRDRLLLDVRARQRRLGQLWEQVHAEHPRPARAVRGRASSARSPSGCASASGGTAASSRRASSSSGSPAAGSIRSRTCATCAASTPLAV